MEFPEGRGVQNKKSSVEGVQSKVLAPGVDCILYHRVLRETRGEQDHTTVTKQISYGRTKKKRLRGISFYLKESQLELLAC